MSGGQARWNTFGGVPTRQRGGWDKRRAVGVQIDGFSPLYELRIRRFFLCTDMRRTQDEATMPSTPWMGMWSG